MGSIKNNLYYICNFGLKILLFVNNMRLGRLLKFFGMLKEDNNIIFLELFGGLKMIIWVFSL